MGKVLGIDYGTRRVGIALSDETQCYAFPRGVIEHQGKRQLFSQLARIIRDEQVERIVVGLPLTMRGERGQQAQAVQSLMGELEELVNIPVDFEDERLTSAYADRFRGASVGRDSLAAAAILESYLERKRQAHQ